MSSLTRIAYVVRQGVVIIGILLVVIIIGSFAWGLVKVTDEIAVVIPTPSPSVLFGRIPPIVFPPTNDYPTSLFLETIQGGPPVSTGSANIYFVPNKAPNLFSRKNAENFAAKLGFTQNPTEINATTLSFTDSETQDTLVVDITTNNFKLRRNFVDPSVFTNESLPAELQLKKLAQEYFVSINVWNSSLSQAVVEYFAFSGSNIVPVDQARDAQLARIYFMRPEIDRFSILTTDVHRSGTSILFAASENRITTILEASYNNFPPDPRASATYPTISGEQAWEKLVAGEGYIARASADTVTVREGYIGYFQEENYHPYLQPVYVFEGDGGFVGMVPAIDPVWFGQE